MKLRGLTRRWIDTCFSLSDSLPSCSGVMDATHSSRLIRSVGEGFVIVIAERWDEYARLFYEGILQMI